MRNRIARTIAVAGAAVALIFGGAAVSQAKNGADDGPGHHSKGHHSKGGHHKGGHHKGGHHKGGQHSKSGGSDDGVGPDLGDDHGQGDDDGPGHDVDDDHGEHGPNHD